MRPLSMAAVLALLLAGCERETTMSDLRALVAETETPVSAKVIPLTTKVAARKLQYATQNERSPFQNPLTPTPQKGFAESSAATVFDPEVRSVQSKSAVMNLDELTMVGTLSGLQLASAQALFRDRDGHIHRLSVGDVIGPNKARIVAVSETRVELLERVPQQDGGWIVQPRTFLLSQQQPSDF